MILRPSYIEAIAPFIDQPLVKILAGVRRCGKSTIFEMLADELRRRGVPEDRIIKKRYTEMDIPADISAKDMYDDLKLQIQGKDRCYLLLDEIQEVKGWEKTVNSQLKRTAKEHSRRAIPGRRKNCWRILSASAGFPSSLLASMIPRAPTRSSMASITQLSPGILSNGTGSTSRICSTG